MIYILGSIGSGKSSITQILAQDLGSTPYYEDVNNGLIKGLLEDFYSAGAESRKEVSAMLQVGFLTYRYAQLKRAITERNAVMDSHILSDALMSKMIYQRGEMSKNAYNVYVSLAQQMQSNVNGTPWNGYPDLIVYLDISLEQELASIASRGRDMEDVNKDPELVDYYTSVNKAYKNWYRGYVGAPVVKIDRAKYDYVNSQEDRNRVLDTIEKKLVEIGQLSESEFKGIQSKRNVLL